MSRARRVDSNHSQIVRELRQVRAVVLDVHALPGVLDLVVAFRGNLYILEVKDGSLPPSARRLTPAEVETIALLEGAGVKAHIVTSSDEALRVIGAV